jgi:hypothetical protein
MKGEYLMLVPETADGFRATIDAGGPSVRATV